MNISYVFVLNFLKFKQSVLRLFFFKFNEITSSFAAPTLEVDFFFGPMLKLFLLFPFVTELDLDLVKLLSFIINKISSYHVLSACSHVSSYF